MSRKLICSCNLLLGMTLVLFGVGIAEAQTEVTATASWSSPTYGPPVDHYVLQHSINGDTWTTIATPTDTLYTLTITEGDSHRVRVAGVDAEGLVGPYSLPSPDYIPGSGDLGEPGQPGKPLTI